MTFREQLAAIKDSGRGILVVGLGISGVETARFLARAGHRVAIVERQTEELFLKKSKFAEQLPPLRALGVSIHFGIDGEQVVPHLSEVGLVVLSPGVPLESSIVGTITRHNIPYVSELELGIELHGGRTVVVTGSNGKSTTVSLIHHILQEAGVPSYLCGNVGTPVISNAELLNNSATRSTLVVEASSYQLEACTVLKPSVSVLLNVSENHLERHGSIERYAAAKARALTLQEPTDLTVVNADDAVVMARAKSGRVAIAAFGQKSEAELAKLAGEYVQIGGVSPLTLRARIGGALEEYDTSVSRLIGLHNRYNIAAAILATRRLGVSRESIQKSLATFAPLEHRLEVVIRDGGRLIINDSKSTTVAASVAALTTVRQHFPAERVAVMIGGLSKAGSWEPLLAVLRSIDKSLLLPVVCFGKDGPLLASHCKAAGVPFVVAKSMQEGTARALESTAGSSAVVLLTPGCASFDEFTDFEDRGAHFKRYVTATLSAGVKQTTAA